MSTRQRRINPLRDRQVRANLQATEILAERGLLPEPPADTVEDGDEGAPLLDALSTELQQNGGES